MITSTQWQLARAAAERYQSILTPAILGPFAEALVEFATLQPGEQIVDVGCGTGAAARCAAAIVGPAGHVTGVDVNEGMIEVAQSLPTVSGTAIEWRVADAAQLPLADDSVDVALCAQTLQFLPDKLTCLAEMQRVIKANGRIVLSLWCDMADNPYFDGLVTMMARHVGSDTAGGLGSAFALTDAYEIYQLLQQAGLAQIEMSITTLDLLLPPLAEFVPRHISATPMAAGFSRASATAQQVVIRDVIANLRGYEVNGRVSIPFRSHMIMARK